MTFTSLCRWPRWLLALAALWLAGCATTTPGGVAIDTRHSSQGQDSRVLFLIIHYTVADLPLSLKVLTQGEVSVHYMISDDARPVIYRLVDEDKRAWHAGVSAWQGHAMLNSSSIGIEIVHPGFRMTPGGREYLPFPPAQIDALIPLVKDIVKRHGIRPDRILGHSDIAPHHKEDPGPTFPWKRLADEGLVPWPDAVRVAALRVVFDAALPDVAWFQKSLAKHGFAVPQTGELDAATRRVVSAFQMRYRPANHDGTPDAETAAILHALIAPS